jgi:hypothetical protein
MALTEREWRTLKYPAPMLDFLGRSASPRKLRLFACACCRWLLQASGDGRQEFPAVERAEDLAEGEASFESCRKARESAPSWERAALEYCPWTAARWTAVRVAHRAGRGATDPRSDVPPGPPRVERERAAMIAQTDLLREIFGNPLQPIEFPVTWRTVDVVDLARAIHTDRAFDRLPILGDALLDAGCDHEEILEHCRVEASHVRGCWVVDLALGKS